jgi:hypothetical protein
MSDLFNSRISPSLENLWTGCILVALFVAFILELVTEDARDARNSSLLILL